MKGYISRLPVQGDSAGLFPHLAGWPRRVAILGSTGSIGVNALRFLAPHRDKFRVEALAGARNIALLAGQAAEWRPPYLAVLDEAGRKELLKMLPTGYEPEVLVGPSGYAALASLPETASGKGLVLSAQVGAAGLAATAAAARAGKIIALANKESLVLAGGILRKICMESGALILPVDSEHNAIFQCLEGRDYRQLRRLILTASGGPFRGRDANFLKTVTPAMALAHPKWSMGAKISIDSASMMNKGLEIIEAHHLYGVPPDYIAVLVHPQSVVHSLVEFKDGSMLAQAGTADMRLAIGHALAWPERLESGVPPLDLLSAGPLTFEQADVSVFRSLALAVQALQLGQGLPVVLNAANEVAVSRFLTGSLPFTGIADMVEEAMEAHQREHKGAEPQNLEEVYELDAATRQRLKGI